MHVGTGRVASRNGSAMRKRGRSSSGASAQGSLECPICYDALCARTEKRPFQCDHALCVTCHTRMLDEEDNRCPECRAPRVGLSREQAEPSPSRNHPPPTLDDLVADMPPALRDMLDLMNDQANSQPRGFASGVAHGYGLPPGHRPNTGHTVFFAVQTPTDWAPNQRERAQDAVRTLVASSTFPREAIEGLLNVPEVPLDEWHRRFVRGQQASGGLHRNRTSRARAASVGGASAAARARRAHAARRGEA